LFTPNGDERTDSVAGTIELAQLEGSQTRRDGTKRNAKRFNFEYPNSSYLNLLLVPGADAIFSYGGV